MLTEAIAGPRENSAINSQLQGLGTLNTQNVTSQNSNAIVAMRATLTAINFSLFCVCVCACVQVVAVCTTTTWNDSGISAAVYNHIKHIRSVDRYKHSVIWAFIEKNYGGDVMSSRIADMIKQSPGANRIYEEVQHGQLRPGFCQSAGFKESATQTLVELLNKQRFHIANEFVSNLPTKEMLQKMFSQLSSFRREREDDDNNPFKKPREVLSGKKTGPDDIVTTLCQSCEWALRSLQNPEFIAMCRKFAYDTGI